MAEDITTITVIRPPGRDRFGDPLPGTGTTFQIGGCRFAPRSADEIHASANQVMQGAAIYGPPDMDVRATDQVVVYGKKYAVDGEPQVWGSFGTVVVVKRITG